MNRMNDTKSETWRVGIVDMGECLDSSGEIEMKIEVGIEVGAEFEVERLGRT